MILNKKTDTIPKTAIYIGRPTKWGNPFVMTKEEERNNVCDKYIIFIMEKKNKYLREEARKELKDKDLVCYCSPKRCHGDILQKIAHSKNDEELFDFWQPILKKEHYK